MGAESFTEGGVMSKICKCWYLWIEFLVGQFQLDLDGHVLTNATDLEILLPRRAHLKSILS